MTLINKNTVLLVVLLIFVAGCRFPYSLRPPVTTKAQTVMVQYFPNNAPLVQSSLSQTFTEGLKDIFITQSNIMLVTTGGDIVFEGAITNYQNKPTAIQENSAALNRLTITVNVKFTNNLEPDNDFEQSFSAFAEYDASQSLSDVEDELIKEIVGQLTEDIFNKAVVNW